MSIRLVPDVGAPILVTAVDLLTESYAPQSNEWMAYAFTLIPYVAAGFNKGGDFTKNVGISSLPWAAKKIYNRARFGVSARSSRLSPRARTSVSRYPGPAQEAPFQGVRLV